MRKPSSSQCNIPTNNSKIGNDFAAAVARRDTQHASRNQQRTLRTIIPLSTIITTISTRTEPPKARVTNSTQVSYPSLCIQPPHI